MRHGSQRRADAARAPHPWSASAPAAQAAIGAVTWGAGCASAPGLRASACRRCCNGTCWRKRGYGCGSCTRGSGNASRRLCLPPCRRSRRRTSSAAAPASSSEAGCRRTGRWGRWPRPRRRAWTCRRWGTSTCCRRRRYLCGSCKSRWGNANRLGGPPRAAAAPSRACRHTRPASTAPAPVDTGPKGARAPSAGRAAAGRAQRAAPASPCRRQGSSPCCRRRSCRCGSCKRGSGSASRRLEASAPRPCRRRRRRGWGPRRRRRPSWGSRWAWRRPSR
mmetsp:Transcript_15158/g.41673  ORF Transcript_15158/g.41673 Transcript_15158/m.41673 type:complete len:277 (+) Transcript_15158:36-866(+)